MTELNTKNTTHKSAKIGAYITCILFVIVVMGIFVATLLKPDKKFSDNENRNLMSMPEVNLSDILEGSFFEQYDKYLTDQFINRDGFIAVKVSTERMLGKKEINGVYFGPKNYLVEAHEKSTVDASVANSNLDQVAQFVANNRDNINVHLMLVPTVSSVYPEWLPSNNQEYDQNAFITQAKDKVGAKYVVDAGEELKKHKDDYIFYKTDHHWTSLGAYYGYRAYMNQLGLDAYELADFERKVVTNDFWGTTYSKVNLKKQADNMEIFTLKNGPQVNMSLNKDGSEARSSLYDMERLKIKDKYTLFLGGNNPYVEITTSVDNDKTLLLVKDSYAHSLVPFLANHYERIILLDYRYYNKSTKKLMKEKEVTDVLVMYNVMNFVTDKSLIKINK